MDSIKETIRHYIACTWLPGEAPDALTDDTPLQTSGILDSLAIVNLIAFIEQQYNIELSIYDTSLEQFDTIRDIATTVNRKQGASEERLVAVLKQRS